MKTNVKPMNEKIQIYAGMGRDDDVTAVGDVVFTFLRMKRVLGNGGCFYISEGIKRQAENHAIWEPISYIKEPIDIIPSEFDMYSCKEWMAYSNNGRLVWADNITVVLKERE